VNSDPGGFSRVTVKNISVHVEVGYRLMNLKYYIIRGKLGRGKSSGGNEASNTSTG